MHARVSASPPSETAFRTAPSKDVDSRKAMIASGTVPWQETSNRYPGRIYASDRPRS